MIKYAGVAQLVERQPSKLNVASSTLVSRSTYEPLAQSVEHMTFNHGVTGSIPVWLTTSQHTYVCLQLSWIEQRPSKPWARSSNLFRHATWIYSSVGQSPRLITGWSLVQVQLDPPFAPFVQWLGHRVFIPATGVRSPQGVPNTYYISSLMLDFFLLK